MTKTSARIKILLPSIIAYLVAALTGLFSPESFLNEAGTIAGHVFLIPVITQFLKEKLNLSGKEFKLLFLTINATRLTSWVVGIALSVLSYYLELGFFAELGGWLQAVVVGILCGLAANGYVTIEMIMNILKLLWPAKRLVEAE